MKKLMNIRPIFFFALSLVIGGYVVTACRVYEWVVFLILGVLLGLIILGVVDEIINKRIKLFSLIICTIVLPVILAELLVGGSVDKRLNNYNYTGTYTISGTVVEGGTQDSTTSVNLNNVTIFDNSGGRHKITGVIRVIEFETPKESVSAGDRITITGRYKNTYLEKLKESPLNANSRVGYVTKAKLITKESGKGVKYNILKWARNTIKANLSGDAGEVAYAMIFGDKTFLSEDLRDEFNATGLSHILAVSGLHVGFITIILSFVLKLFIKKKNVVSLLIIVGLLIYAYLCSFSPSVVRAVCMAGVASLAMVNGAMYDQVNAISVAGIINVFMSPTNIFNIGFLLSFAVVFSIITFSKKFLFYFDGILPEKLAGLLSVSLSAFIGGLPITLYFFNSLSIISLVMNIVIVPLISFVFIILVGALIISFILPIFKEAMLVIPNFIIVCLNKVVSVFGSLDRAVVPAYINYVQLLLGVLVILMCGDLTFYPYKKTISRTAAVGYCLICVVSSLAM